MNKRGVFNNLNKTLFLGGFCSLMASFLLGLGSNSVFANSFSITTGNDPVLEINLSSSLLELNLTPKPDVPVFNTTNLTVTAGTNNLTGYTLYMNVDNPNLNRTESLANNTTPSINSLTSNTEGYTESTFTTNSWGYHLPGETNYFAIPTKQLQLSTSPEPVNENTTTITFASKVDMTLPAGSYTTNMTFYAVTNAPVPTMQDIDNWKDSLIADHSIKAQDTRDGKYYNVTKLSSDNRIWMTQNLNLSGGTTLTSADSNVKENYTLPASSTTGFNEYSVAYVYNDKTYGGYYSYAAATAGTNPGTNDSIDINATSDICPKGWRLPTKAEYDALKSTYTTGATLTAAPWNGEYGGSYYNSIAYNIGSMGNYWTSTASYTNMAYIVSIEDAVVSIYDDSNYYGSSIRCLAKKDTIITYNANGGTGKMTKQTITDAQVVAGIGQQFTANTFTRDGYVFTGWNTKADGSGTPYSNGATYSGPSTTLYAQWRGLTITDFAYMQDFANLSTSAKTSVKNSMAVDTVYQLKDSRDNKTYNITKFSADDSIWMTQNLNLAGSTEIESTKSNVPEGYTLPTSAGFQSGNKLPASSTVGFDDYTKAFVYNDSTYGGYYSYIAVTAGTNPSTDGANAPSDICPKGWRLPTRGIYNTLKYAYNTLAKITAAPWYGAYGGRYYNGSTYGVGSFGFYWTSTASSSSYAYGFSFHSPNVGFNNSDMRYGYLVRCVSQ